MSDNIKCGDMVYFRMFRLGYNRGLWKGRVIILGKHFSLIKISCYSLMEGSTIKTITVPNFLIYGKVQSEN